MLRRWLERIGAFSWRPQVCWDQSLCSGFSWRPQVCWDQSLCSGFSWRPQVCCLLVSFQLSKAIWSILSVIRSIQNAQQAIRHSSVIFVAPYWNYRISCLKVQLAPFAQDADSEKWNISLDYVKKKGLSPDLEYFRLPTSKRSRLIIIMPSHCYWS